LRRPIALQEFDEQEYRDFVRTLSDQALIKEGKQVPWLSGKGRIVPDKCRARSTRSAKYLRRKPF
jgi:hypothetical protein